MYVAERDSLRSADMDNWTLHGVAEKTSWSHLLKATNIVGKVQWMQDKSDCTKVVLTGPTGQNCVFYILH